MRSRFLVLSDVFLRGLGFRVDVWGIHDPAVPYSMTAVRPAGYALLLLIGPRVGLA